MTGEQFVPPWSQYLADVPNNKRNSLIGRVTSKLYRLVDPMTFGPQPRKQVAYVGRIITSNYRVISSSHVGQAFCPGLGHQCFQRERTHRKRCPRKQGRAYRWISWKPGCRGLHDSRRERGHSQRTWSLGRVDE